MAECRLPPVLAISGSEGGGVGSLFPLSFLEREKKDLGPLDCRDCLSEEENMVVGAGAVMAV